jgi:hypothetical protein
MVLLLGSLKITDPFYFISDAYYATRTVIKGLVVRDNHLISRVRSNGVAYHPAPTAFSGPSGRVAPGYTERRSSSAPSRGKPREWRALQALSMAKREFFCGTGFSTCSGGRSAFLSDS